MALAWGQEQALVQEREQAWGRERGREQALVQAPEPRRPLPSHLTVPRP